MDWLIEILKKDGATPESIIEDVKAEFPKHAIPKEQYNTKASALKVAEEERDSAKEQLEKLNGEIDSFKELAGENEELKTALQKSNDEFSEYKSGESTRTATIEKKHAVIEMLRESGVNKDSVDLVVDKIDLEKITKLESGNYDGFDTQLESLKESRPTLFPTVVNGDGGKPNDGNGGVVGKSATEMMMEL